jgi:methionyl-tRNA synthetase
VSIVEQYKEALEIYDTQRVFALVRDLLDEANGMLNTTEPWKKSGEEKGKLLVDGIIYVYYATLLFSPFIPEATVKVMQTMGIKEGTTLNSTISIDLNTITKPNILFVKK